MEVRGLFIAYTGSGIYLLLALVELQQGIRSPITLASLALFVLSAWAVRDGRFEALLPYSGTLFLGVLALIAGGFLLAGRPFTIFYSAGRGHRGKHWLISGMWTLAYITGAAASFWLMPSISFIYAPMAILALSAVLMLTFNLVWFGPATRRERSFEFDGFRFAQVDGDSEWLEAFYDLTAKEFWTPIRRSHQHVVGSLEALRMRLREGDTPYEDRMFRFMAWKDGVPVGTVCCVLDDGRMGLPVEEESGVRLDHLRALGGVMEVGKFAIASAYRARQPLFLGLLRCAIEVAMERRISFLANDSYTTQANLYRRIGFSDVTQEPFHDANGAECVVLALNLATAIVYERSRDDSTFMNQLIPRLNSYLSERCYHRLVLGFFWRPRAYRPYEQSELMLLAQGGNA